MDGNETIVWEAEQKRRDRKVLLALLVEIPVLAVGLSFLLIYVSQQIDSVLNVPLLPTDNIWRVVSVVLAIPGLGLVFWSSAAQYSFGVGTPVPLVATQKLVVKGPYKYCRNPMSIGSISYFIGLSLWIGSITAALITLGISAVFMFYIKIMEEPNLEDLFGDEYVQYKKETPAYIPRIRSMRGRVR